MKISFPEDRSLSPQSDEQDQLNWVLPQNYVNSHDFEFEQSVVKRLAFASLLIFSRMQQVGELCVRVAFSQNLVNAHADGITEYRESGSKHLFLASKFADLNTLSNSFESTYYRYATDDSLPEIDLSIVPTIAFSDITKAALECGVILAYHFDDKNVFLKLIYRKRLLTLSSAHDFLDKIKIIWETLEKEPTIALSALVLITQTSSKFIPDLALPIDSDEFDLLPNKFFEVAKKYADYPAIAGNEFVYTYSDLHNKTNDLTHRLIRMGVQNGDVISVSGPSSFGTISSILAIMSAGGTVVIIDNLLPNDRRELITKTAAPSFHISADADFVDIATSKNAISTKAWPDPEKITKLPPESLQISISSNTNAYIFFTSGSTGIPKGVLGSHRGLAHFLEWQRVSFPIGPGDRTAQLTALSFDVVLRDLFYPLTSGACIHIPKRDVFLDGRKMLHWMESNKITAMHCVPSLMRAWLLADTSNQPFRTLKYIFFAGEPLTDALLYRFREASSQTTQIINLYGPTETTLAKLSNRITHIETGIQPVGNPQPGVDVVILKERRSICGLWEIGEISIRTPYRSNGYFRNDELTNQAFQRNPARSDPTDLIYFTGDLGRYRSDGKVEIFGRIDSQIKIRGVRIEPNEIESCILSVPRMKDAAVTTRSSPLGDKILFALVVPDLIQDFDSGEQSKILRDLLKDRLHDAMVPARIIFVENLPYLPNGKLDRKTIGTIDIDSADTNAQKTLVTSNLDEKLRRIISSIEQALGIRVTDLGMSFVDLGGDSLSYIRVSLAIEDELGMLPPEWELTPLGKLDLRPIGNQSDGAVQSAWTTIETSVALRALAISFVVLENAKQFHFLATSTLFIISGMSFAKFFRHGILERNDFTPVIKFILRFGIPAFLWELLAVTTKSHSFWLPDLFLMGTYFHDPSHPHYTLWYLDVLAANVLLMSVITALVAKFSGNRQTAKSLFFKDYILIVIALLVSFMQVGFSLWDGKLGETSVAPFKWFWMLAFGVAITQAQTVRDKLLLSLLLISIGCAAWVKLPHISGSFSTLDGFFFVSTFTLIWINRIYIPRILRKSVIGIASASLFIYIVNQTVIQRTRTLVAFDGSWLLEAILAVTIGIISYWTWSKIEALLLNPRETYANCIKRVKYFFNTKA